MEKITDSKKNINKPKTKNLPISYALIVDKNKDDHRRIVNEMKTAVKNTDEADIIKSVKTAKDGKLIITTINNDNEAMTSLKKHISKIINDDTKVRISTRNANKVSIHIRGMDIDTNSEDVIEAIENETGRLSEGSYKLSALRPNANGTQAATFTAEEKIAEKLLAQNWMRIGLVRCSLERQIILDRCNKCWSYDHETGRCSGKDHSKNCFKCGKTDHTAKDCKNAEFCLCCNEAGHAAGSGKCAEFKKALAKARKNYRASVITLQPLL